MLKSQASVPALFLASAMSLIPLSQGLAQDAQEEGTDQGLRVELNALQQNEAACRVTFVVNNELGSQLDETAFEMALFDQDGLVARMTVVDFGMLEPGRTKVRQFDLPDTQCASIGRVLVNDATKCAGAEIDANDCMANLDATSRSDVEFGS